MIRYKPVSFDSASCIVLVSTFAGIAVVAGSAVETVYETVDKPLDSHGKLKFRLATLWQQSSHICRLLSRLCAVWLVPSYAFHRKNQSHTRAINFTLSVPVINESRKQVSVNVRVILEISAIRASHLDDGFMARSAEGAPFLAELCPLLGLKPIGVGLGDGRLHLTREGYERLVEYMNTYDGQLRMRPMLFESREEKRARLGLERASQDSVNRMREKAFLKWKWPMSG